MDLLSQVALYFVWSETQGEGVASVGGGSVCYFWDTVPSCLQPDWVMDSSWVDLLKSLGCYGPLCILSLTLLIHNIATDEFQGF